MYSGTRPSLLPLTTKYSISFSLDLPIEKVVDHYYRAAFEAHGRNVTRTCKSLGISVRTLQRHFKIYGPK